MKINFTPKKKLSKLYKLVLLIGTLIAYSITVTAQQFVLETATGSKIEVNAQNTTTLCQAPNPFWGFDHTYFHIIPEIFPAGPNAEEGFHHVAQAGRNYELILDIPNVPWLYPNSIIKSIHGEPGVDLHEQAHFGNNDERPGFIRHRINYTFDLGTREGFLAFNVKEQLNGDSWGHLCILRFIVEGPVTSNVPILDTITEPQMPYLVLHAPPGDQSVSSFQSNKKMCRTLSTNYATEGSNSVNTALKIGVAGEAGLFVTTEFEFSVTINAGLTVGNMSYEASTNETCLNISEGFTTSSMLDDDGGGDIFVGYGTDMAVGSYPYYRADAATCRSVMDTGLVFAPVGDLRQFALTKSGIQVKIDELQEFLSDSLNQDARSLNNTKNQIDVWNQVLELNDTNINNPNNEPMGLAFDLDATAKIERSEQVTVAQTHTIEYKRFTKVNLGVSAKVEVAGSGFEGGYEFAGAKTYGESTTTSTEESKLINYTLEDDDMGDNFRIQIQRDPMFGTPIFKVDDSKTKSSCPYQRGYQRDQPLLLLNGGDQEITLENIPVGGSATFQLQVCNESDEDRTYHLKGNSNTNLNDVILTGFGNNLFNTNDNGVEFADVPAKDCLDPATITIKQGNENILNYEGIELLLNVDCQPSGAPIKSSIFINASFGEMTSTTDIANHNELFSAYPNPAQDVIHIRFAEVSLQEGYLHLINMNGQMVKKQQVRLNSKSMKLEVDDLDAGLYQLLFTTDTQQQIERIVLVR